MPSQVYSILTIPLQLFVSKISVALAAFLEVPIYREGNVLYLPDKTFQVVQACSGLRSMISLLTLSLILGYFTLRSNSLKIVLFFSGIPVAVLVNIVRVSLLVLAFYYLGLDLTSEGIHTVFGMLIFLLALISIVGFKVLLSFWDKKITDK